MEGSKLDNEDKGNKTGGAKDKVGSEPTKPEKVEDEHLPSVTPSLSTKSTGSSDGLDSKDKEATLSSRSERSSVFTESVISRESREEQESDEDDEASPNSKLQTNFSQKSEDPNFEQENDEDDNPDITQSEMSQERPSQDTQLKSPGQVKENLLYSS